MNDDVSDGVLLDVSGRDLAELLDEKYDSGLTRVLERVRAAGGDAYSGWQSAI
jgi:FXSXX-COOH protein